MVFTPSQTLLSCILCASMSTAFAQTETSAPEATDEGGIDIGIMECHSVPGSGQSRIISSSVEVECQMHYRNGDVEHYVGETGVRAGLDLSFERESVFFFTVLSSSRVEPLAGFMGGEFRGAKAGISLGLGAGVNVLIGGTDDKLTLSPMAPETGTGLGLAAGAAYLKLQAVE